MNPSCLLLIAIPLCLFPSCASSPLPPRLNSVEAGRLSELPLSYSVGVVPHKYPVYSEKLMESLNAAGIFSEVAPLSDFKTKPDLVATIEKEVYGNAVIPVLLFASGGVIPNVGDEGYGLIFSLAPSSHRNRKTMVDASYSGTSTLGWAALPVNLSSDYTFGDPENSDRFRQMLGYRTLIALRPRKAAAGR